MLAHGLGRSYGDSCLVNGGTLIRMHRLNKLRHFDIKSGLLSCEAGLSIDELLQFAVPRGWFIPVSPGTKFVTLGGAIANDVHGKNHHKRGTIGSHILEMELFRSNGERIQCSLHKDSELFKATIGGLGLTGIILSCTIQLMKIESAWIDAELIKTSGLEEFFEIDRTSEKDFEYTVSWIDCMAKGDKRGRGIYIRGNHAKGGDLPGDYQKQQGFKVAVPIDAPGWTLNPLSIKLFNQAYYHKQLAKRKYVKQGFNPFFYPLDAVDNWNRLYGSQGLLQYQCILPVDKIDELKTLFDMIAKSGQGSFLAVLKRFGDIPSPGLLSFPFEGYTLSLDFRNIGQKARELFDELDKVVLKAGGRLYPAKDLLMSPTSFQTSYPNWQEFARYIDPKCQSMFWERVTKRV
ncbi:MAG: FAD-binding oxidoreductase [Proteobacteria bacterium]|nr:MAG: FAD-binding oxidoreductase [Pseudomonadota bacterium]